MRKLILLLALLLPSLAVADTLSGTLLDSNGNRVAGALVTVCPTGSTGTPCSPVLQVGVTALDGTWFFTIATGNYDVTFTRAGLISTKLTSIATGVPVVTPISGNITLLGTLNALGGGQLVGTFGGNHTLSGNITFLGNNTLTAGQNALNFWVHNNIYWTGTSSANYPFTTPQTSIANCVAQTFFGCRVDLVSGNSFTTSTPTDIGTSAHSVSLVGYPDIQWTCTDTNGGSDYCWGLHQASAMQGSNIGQINPNRVAGFHLKYDCTAKTSYGLSTVEGLGGAQANGMLRNIMLEGCNTGTVAGGGSPSVALFNWQGIDNVHEISNIVAFQFANTIGIRYANDGASANNALGPVIANNMWADGNGNTGAVPCAVQGQALSAILLLTFVGGTCNHPGTGLNPLNIDYHLNPAASWGGSTNGTYLEENLYGNANMIDLFDASNWAFNTVAWSSLSGNKGFNIHQDITGGSCGIQINGLRVSQTPQIGINNTISGYSSSGFRFYAPYHYGGDSTCSISPYTIDSNTFQIINKTGIAFLEKNNADSELDLALDSGTTVGENAYIWFKDRGTSEYQFGKTAANGINLTETSSGLSFFNHNLAGTTNVNSATGANAVQFGANANTGTAGIKIFNGAATPIGVSTIDGSGNVFFHCATTSFQNCGEITGTFTGGATPRIITAPDSPSVTPSFLTCGTTSTCAQTNQTRLIVLNGGPIALSAGTLTITSLPFTSSTSYVCNPDDSTGINGIDVVYVSGASVTFNGTGTDSIRYTCIGN